MEHVKDLDAKVNNCSYLNEYINSFCNKDQEQSLTFNQCLL